MSGICHGDGLTTLHLKAITTGIELFADIDSLGFIQSPPFHDVVRPGESFGGYSFEELAAIANTQGQMNADELKV
jgi:hypothetical protein